MRRFAQNAQQLRYAVAILLAASCLLSGIWLMQSEGERQRAAEQTLSIAAAAGQAADLAEQAELAAARPPSKSWLPAWTRLQTDLSAADLGAKPLSLRMTVLLEGKLAPATRAAEARALRREWNGLERRLYRQHNAEAARNSAAITWAGSWLPVTLGMLAWGLFLWQTWRRAAVVQDATLLERSFREQEARQRSMLEQTREILLQTDLAGHIQRGNHRVSETSVRDLFRRSEEWDDAVAQLGDRQELALNEIWLRLGASDRVAECRIRPVRNEAGEIQRLDVSLLDVTAAYVGRQAQLVRINELEAERDRLQRQLRDLLTQSLELAERREAEPRGADRRLASIRDWAKRLDQPLEELSKLAAQLGNSVAIDEQRAATSGLSRTLTTVSTSLRALSRLASAPEGMPAPAHAGESVEPRALAERIMARCAPLAEVSGVQLGWSVPADLPMELQVAAAGKFEPAIHAMLADAVRTGAAATAILRLRWLADSPAASSGRLRVEVDESGRSFSGDETAARFAASGPWADVASAAVELGGSFGAAGRGTEAGTLVWLELPAIQSAESPARRAASGIRVLVADPSPVRRAGVVESLEGLGLSATGCENAEQAWQELISGVRHGAPFACVLASAGLPPSGAPALAARLAGPESPGVVRFVMLLPRSEQCRATDYAALPGVSAAVPAPAGLEELALCLSPLLPGGAALLPRGGPGGARTPARLPEPSWRVLVAEDDKVNQRVVLRMIERMGGQVHLTANGIDAVEASARGGFDLVLMDCQMPEMDGFEATLEIRRREAAAGRPRLPIIALTANAMPGDREACLGAGMDDYLPKPVRFDDLRAAVARWRPPSSANLP